MTANRKEIIPGNIPARRPGTTPINDKTPKIKKMTDKQPMQIFEVKVLGL
jgi:hypothetical protein